MATVSVRTADRAPAPPRAGVGVRFRHHREILDLMPDIGWIEVHAENYFGGGTPRACLQAIREHYPVSLHGVGLSLGSAEGVSERHLSQLRSLVDRMEPVAVSDHVSWSAVDGTHFPDLLPLPLTEEALAVFCRNVDHVQATLGRPILIENPSSYLRFRHSTIPEWEFVAEAARRTGCFLLCDVNNIAVSGHNHGFDPLVYLAALPSDRVREIHVAGHRVRALDDGREIRIDDHGSRVSDEVWALYARAVALFGPTPTIVEWDVDVPALGVLTEEAGKADRLVAAGEAGTARRMRAEGDAHAVAA